MAETAFEFSGLDDLSEPFTVHSTASYPPLVEADGDLDYIENSAWLTDELGSVVLDNQHYRTFFPGLRVNSQYLFAVPSR